ncbi:MAG TPA: hypothetical protein HPP87_01760 [Planctomycetes bacterium]|nr:hypothetical protein [Planctomycetota bacterium]HIJ70072.1 hypothetical protein [Planctomycetota bacterium]
MTIRRIPRWHVAAAFAAILTLISLTPAIQAEADEDMWSDEPTEMRQRPGLSDERAEEFLDRLAELHPERAAELRKLREDNPDQFGKEIRQAFAERHHVGDRRGGEFRGQGRSGERPGRRTGRRDSEHSGRRTGPGLMRDKPGADGQRERGAGHSGRGERWRQHFERRHDEYIEWLDKNFPEEAGKLARLREREPEDLEEYIRQVIDSRDKFGEIMEAEERNPELAEVLKEDFEIKREREILLEKIRSAKGKQSGKLNKQLEELVNRRFDLIVRKKQLRYEHLLRRLERLQKEVRRREADVEKMKNKKPQLIKERLEELTGRSEKINWD